MSARRPTFNGIVKELQALKRGLGLHVSSIDRLLSCPHLQRALGLATGRRFSEAYDMRNALIAFVADSRLSPKHQRALHHVLNWDSLDYRLGRRRADLAEDLGVGPKKARKIENNAIDLLAEQLIHPAKPAEASS
jgi:hypothetical protein